MMAERLRDSQGPENIASGTYIMLHFNFNYAVFFRN